MSRSPSVNRAYMKSYYKDPENRRIKRKRDVDRYERNKKWKIPKGMELDHSKGYGRGKKQVITRTANRRKAARKTNKVRTKVN